MNNSNKQINITNDSNKGFLSETTSITIIIIGLVAIFVTGLLFLFCSGNIFSTTENIDSERFDHFGGIVGGFIGAMWSLAGVILFYIALKEQKKATSMQKEELELQRKELAQTREVFELQNQTIKLQQFESTFFNLLNLHHLIVSSIDVVKDETIYPTRVPTTGHVLYQEISPEHKERLLTSRDCFHYFYNEFLNIFEKNKNKEENKEILDKIHYSYNEFYLNYQSDLGHYFRNLYNIVKFIDRKSFDDKIFYSNLLRAQLSSYELVLLFYNCLSHYGKKFKPLLEKYHFLQNMPQRPLIDREHTELYDKRAYGKPDEY